MASTDSDRLSPQRLRASSSLYPEPTSPTSPTRLHQLAEQGLLNEESPNYRSAMEKLYEASWKFDRGKNGDLLKTLDNRELYPDQFRQILRSGLNVKLTNDEFAAIFPLLDNNGKVNGCEFILLFYRFRYEHRSKLLTERVEVEKKHRTMMKAMQRQQQESFEKKRHLELVSDYTEQDLQSALSKILEAAVKYDKMMPGAVPLDAFVAEYMNPGEFREQMKLVFHLPLSVKEVSAFFHHFNQDQAEKNLLNCASFLVSFFRMGFNEKSRRLKAFWEEKKRIERERERKRLEEEKELASKNALKVNFTFTEEDKEKAIIKLRAAAKLYDKTTPGAMSMKAFEVKEMPPHIFKEQLRRVFNLNVTPPEMGALMAVFDVNGDGVITCEEFTKVFINMGFEEREKELKAAIEKQKRYEQRQLEEQEKKRQEFEAKNALKVSYTYTEEEQMSAMQKLTEAAWKYDKNMPGAPCLDAFESYDMEPHVLKLQLKMAFQMKVTPQELGAIIHFFDPEKTGRIVCADFLKKFFKIGFEERQRQTTAWREHQKELNKQRIEEEKRKLEALDNKSLMLLSSQSSSLAIASENGSLPPQGQIPGREYTEKDFKSAFTKLTQGAVKFDKSLPGAAPLNAFDTVTMPPHIFREQLKLVFNIKTTVQELWALVAYFDKNNSGEVHCKTFINQFIRTGIDERNRIKTLWKVEQQQKLQERKKLEEQKEIEKTMKAWQEVDFDFSEQDFDYTLHRFVRMAGTVDKRTIGPAGLVAFQVESLNPSEFREMMKRTFNFKLSSRELGALVMIFDTQMKKCVHCSSFLNAMTQIRVQYEEFKGKPDEQARAQELEKQLKASYQARVARNPSVDARPWRQENALTQHPVGGKKVFKKPEGGPPKDATEKFRLRILIGRKTGRMDLACKEVWPNGHSRAVTQPNSPTKPSRRHSSQEGEITTLDENEILGEESDGQVSDEKVPEGEGDEDIAPIFAEVLSGDCMDDIENAEGGVKAPPTVSGKMDIEFRLFKVPPEMFRLSELRELWLCNHSISVIPEAIGEMKQLQVISFRNNQIETVPSQLCNCANLQRLYLQGNMLSILPNVFGKLKELVELDLSRNQFSDFPEVLSTVTQLITLKMSQNRLTKLPKGFLQLKSLVLLDVEGNRFDQAPPVLAKMPWLEVKGCTLPSNEAAAKTFSITPVEEYELLNMLKSRSAFAITSKLRRRKKKSGYDL